jgi:hypothetical protein
MSQPQGHLWVDPDGVSRVGDSYAEHVEIYQRYLSQLVSLRQRYANSWGNDDMGTQFSSAFLGGIDNLEKLIGGIKGTLEYTATGLRESGKLYREADDAAREVSNKMARNVESTLTTLKILTARAPEEPGSPPPAQEGGKVGVGTAMNAPPTIPKEATRKPSLPSSPPPIRGSCRTAPCPPGPEIHPTTPSRLAASGSRQPTVAPAKAGARGVRAHRVDHAGREGPGDDRAVRGEHGVLPGPHRAGPVPAGRAGRTARRLR